MSEENIQTTFEEIYELLVTFSGEIEGIQKTSFELTVLLKKGLPPSWNEFIDYFNMGAYFHHRCQGYVEALFVTDAFSPRSIEIWIHELVDPAADNFMHAMKLMNDVKEIPAFKGSEQLATLEKQMKAFQKTAEKILAYTKDLDERYS